MVYLERAFSLIKTDILSCTAGDGRITWRANRALVTECLHLHYIASGGMRSASDDVTAGLNATRSLFAEIELRDSACMRTLAHAHAHAYISTHVHSRT